jgi:preprotein translocase SecE subunit
MQGSQRYVILAYVGFAVLMAMTLNRLLAFLAATAGLPDAQLLGANFTVTTLLGFIGGIAGTYALYKNPVASGYSDEVVDELEKVTWPSKQETQTATTVVIVATLAMAVVIFVFDWIWSALTGVIYQ